MNRSLAWLGNNTQQLGPADISGTTGEVSERPGVATLRLPVGLRADGSQVLAPVIEVRSGDRLVDWGSMDGLAERYAHSRSLRSVLHRAGLALTGFGGWAVAVSAFFGLVMLWQGVSTLDGGRRAVAILFATGLPLVAFAASWSQQGENKEIFTRRLSRPADVRALFGNDPAAFLRALGPVGSPTGPDRLIETLEALALLDGPWTSKKAEELAAEKLARLRGAWEPTRAAAATGMRDEIKLIESVNVAPIWEEPSQLGAEATRRARTERQRRS